MLLVAVSYCVWSTAPNHPAFHPGAQQQNTQQAVKLEDGSMACYFPRAGEPAKPELIGIIQSAKETLDIAIYSFTDTDICNEILKAKDRGVSVRLITDRSQSGGAYQKPLIRKIKNKSIPVKIDSHSGIMHLKVTIADQKVATTGSYNYTKSAEKKNDEVFVVIQDKTIAGQFEKEFESMWNDSADFENY